MSKNLGFIILISISISACNPYKGFTGVTPKGMKKSTLPSQEVRNDYKRSEKKMKRQYKREMKRRTKKMGSTPQ